MTDADSRAQDRSAVAGWNAAAKPGFEPDQGLAGQLAGRLGHPRRPVPPGPSKPGDQPERDGVA